MIWYDVEDERSDDIQLRNQLTLIESMEEFKSDIMHHDADWRKDSRANCLVLQ